MNLTNNEWKIKGLGYVLEQAYHISTINLLEWVFSILKE
jgi:hypothetical protein